MINIKKCVGGILGTLLIISVSYGDDKYPSAFLPEQSYTFEPVVEGTKTIEEPNFYQRHKPLLKSSKYVQKMESLFSLI